jgi:hypothetical protein
MIVRRQGASIAIGWRLGLSDGVYKIQDVAIDGVSMALAQRSQIAALIPLEAEHHSDALLHAPMVLLYLVIQMFRRAQLRVRSERAIGFQFAHRTVGCGVAVQRAFNATLTKSIDEIYRASTVKE